MRIVQFHWLNNDLYLRQSSSPPPDISDGMIGDKLKDASEPLASLLLENDTFLKAVWVQGL